MMAFILKPELWNIYGIRLGLWPLHIQRDRLHIIIPFVDYISEVFYKEEL